MFDVIEGGTVTGQAEELRPLIERALSGRGSVPQTRPGKILMPAGPEFYVWFDVVNPKTLRLDPDPKNMTRFEGALQYARRRDTGLPPAPT